MRHNKKVRHLGRTKSHREALLSNMANSLLLHKRIFTTVAKAKALRMYVEPIITKAKTDTTHSRRNVFALLRNKYAVQELFGPVADKTANRPGGYTRIIKTGFRQGDAAAVCFIELVDFNENMMSTPADKQPVKKTRRSRGKKSAAKAQESTAEEAKTEAAE
ncbi:50S ribosomal protein L17 [Falsiporphyromonas endometrii]|uniref:Large ribosomal subunit protein bL17 n=1 Tax=Falsiporphyromonas endometrii TaxID=1387297 RepID=A0ABV9K597_9PORP